MKNIKRCKRWLPLICVSFALLVFFGGCKKYLDKKPNIAESVPTTVNELQSLLESPLMYSSSPSISDLFTNDVYVSDATWQTNISSASSSDVALAKLYVWSPDALPYDAGWITPYQQAIFYSNNVLDQSKFVTDSNTYMAKFNQVKGAALFYRAFQFYQLAQLFCKPYSSTADTDPGIVLRLTSNINETSTRSTVAGTYNRIIGDFKRAAELLPSTVSSATRPSVTAAYAALARVYLNMRDYNNAMTYADLALKLNSSLMDYNSLVPVATPPIQQLNTETIFYSGGPAAVLLTSSNAKIDLSLYQSYEANDLRKTVFFATNTGANAGTYGFRGSYKGGTSSTSVFDGLATDELYLIRAECSARGGDLNSAMNDLNALLIKRYKQGSFIPLTATSNDDALTKILFERRKELIFRAIRWSDIRRLNLEGANITLSRQIAGTTYTLTPNNPRYLLPIPFDVINRSGIAQNPR